jgi:hypothetical protein
MLESLAFALAKTLISFMFEQHLERMESVRIQGAPGWYYQQTSDHICSSSFADGGLASINLAKQNARNEMHTKISESIQTVVYNNYRHLKDSSERKLVNAFSSDKQLPQFINSTVIYENIEHNDASQKTYVRVCITKEAFTHYQQERASLLASQITHYRSGKSFKELDNSVKSF